MTLQAIQTKYAGCRFRSRLEARWAVFFTAAGIPWEYEPQGFELPCGRYLPDFFLPSEDAWIEIKGGELSATDLVKCGQFARHNQGNLTILKGGIPKEPAYGGDPSWSKDRQAGIPAYGYGPVRPLTAEDLVPETPLVKGDLLEHPVFGWGEVESTRSTDFGTTVDIRFSEGVKRLSIKHSPLRVLTSWGFSSFVWCGLIATEAQLWAALTAARSARFEHGERP
jgi:hypothetical protein